MKTEIINRAIYINRRTSTKDYVPICTYCKKSDSCNEPDKKWRITCPNDVCLQSEMERIC